MPKTALIVGLDVLQVEACRSALGGDIDVLRALDVEDAVALLSVHRSRLVVVRTDMLLPERRLIADLAARIGARVASVGPSATQAAIERLVEGIAAIAFDGATTTTISGTRPRVAPGAYKITSTEPRKKRR